MAVRQGYKQTEVGVIPEDWDVKPLGEIGDVRMCKRVLKHQTREEGDVPFYKIGSFGGTADAFIPQSLFDDFRRKYSFPRKGDVLISAAGTIGRTVIYDGSPAYFQDSNIVWIDNDESKVTNTFLWHSYQVTKWSVSHGGTVARLYNDNLKTKIHIAIPKLSEQRAIASALSDVDALLSGLDRLIAKKRDLKQAAMQQLLTGQTRLPGFEGDWLVRQLGDVAPLQRGFDLPNPNLRPGPYPVIYSNGVLNHHASYQVEGPGVVTGRSGTIGKVTYVEGAYWPHNTALWVTDFKNNNPRFVFYLYSYIDFGRFATGSGVPTLNRNDIHSLNVAIPATNKEQTAIATFLSDMDTELAALEARREKTRLLKQGMMQELLTGKTRLITPERDDA